MEGVRSLLLSAGMISALDRQLSMLYLHYIHLSCGWVIVFCLAGSKFANSLL
jgi:hypothetical protein